MIYRIKTKMLPSLPNCLRLFEDSKEVLFEEAEIEMGKM